MDPAEPAEAAVIRLANHVLRYDCCASVSPDADQTFSAAFHLQRRESEFLGGGGDLCDRDYGHWNRVEDLQWRTNSDQAGRAGTPAVARAYGGATEPD